MTRRAARRRRCRRSPPATSGEGASRRRGRDRPTCPHLRWGQPSRTTFPAMDPVLVSTPREGVRLITLNRPDKLNAMTAELIGQLHDALDDVAIDATCRVVVLTGQGRGFCA